MQEGKKNREQAQAISDIIESYHNRFKGYNEDSIPRPFTTIEQKLLKLKAEGKRLLINSKDVNSLQSVVIKLEYVGKWWAMGKYRCVNEMDEVELPFTFHYSDIISSDTDVVVIAEGKGAFSNG